MNGGTGDDSFQIFRNRGALQLNGEAGDDTFIIRTFIDVDKSTSVNTGGGRDFVQYVANAPVSVDGGDGYDTVVVVGTEAADTFVVTAQGICGAGRFIAYIDVEKLIIEGMEGDDVFYVLSTNANVETAIYGGLGSDTVNVRRRRNALAVDVVQANDLLGHSGLLTNAVEQTSGMWVGVPVDGIGAEIVDNDAPAVILDAAGRHAHRPGARRRPRAATSSTRRRSRSRPTPTSSHDRHAAAVAVGRGDPLEVGAAVARRRQLADVGHAAFAARRTTPPRSRSTSRRTSTSRPRTSASCRCMAMIVGQVGGTAARRRQHAELRRSPRRATSSPAGPCRASTSSSRPAPARARCAGSSRTPTTL